MQSAAEQSLLALAAPNDKKRNFILLRYTFIIATSYLLLFGGEPGAARLVASLVIAAVVSNVLLSFLPERYLFAWCVEMPVVLADTLWVTYGCSVGGIVIEEGFLLYFFVLTLAAVGENVATIILSAVLIEAVTLGIAVVAGAMWLPPALIRMSFFFTVALFYGHSAIRAHQERGHAVREKDIARRLEALVEERTRTLAAKTEELEALYTQAQEANRLKSQLVANLSHEFLTPLHIVLGYIELLVGHESTRREDDTRHLLDRMRQSAYRLFEMVSNLLEFALLESGRMKIAEAPVDLRVLARELIASDQLLHAEFVAVRCEVDDDLPLVTSDADKLRRLLANLLHNAVKFTPRGEVVLSIRLLAASNSVEFIVRDTGIGMRPEDVKIIFDDFRQLDGSLSRRYEGLGIGLAIVRRYAEVLGGSLSVESALGCGSQFSFVLPCAPAGEAQGSQPAIEPALAAAS